jgi:predicted HTH transcriptional regulator
VKILELMEREPTITIPLLSLEIGVTPRAVEKQISKFQKEGLIKRIGPDKGGHWEVVKD